MQAGRLQEGAYRLQIPNRSRLYSISFWLLAFATSLTVQALRRLYIKKSKYAKNRLSPGHARSARFEDSLAAAAPPRLCHHVRDQGSVRRRAPRRGRFAVSGAPSDGGSRVDSRGMDYEGHRAPGAPVG